MDNVYIFDLDGTIADFSHRRQHLTKNPPDYEAFYTDCTNDAPIVHTITTIQLLHKAGAIILIVTGRRGEIKKETEKWLKKHNVPYHVLYMREIGDRRRDFEVKPEMLAKIHEKYSKEEIIAVFDDRPEMLVSWKSMGMKVFAIF